MGRAITRRIYIFEAGINYNASSSVKLIRLTINSCSIICDILSYSSGLHVSAVAADRGSLSLMELETAQRRTCVMIVTSSLNAGGTERIVATIANHWATQKSISVKLAVFEEENTTVYYPLDPDVSLLKIGSSQSPVKGVGAAGMFAKRITKLRREIRAARPDVVISFLTRPNIVALIASMGLSVPVIVSERNCPQLQPLGRVWSQLRQIMYPRAYGLITMTEGALSFFPKHLRKRSWVIPNPLTVEFERHSDPNTFILVAVGRLVPQKGFDLLLEAFAMIADQHPDWTLSIWGEGSDKAKLESQRNALGLQNRVVFAGRSPRPSSWLSEAGAFVMSSRYEGWGNALLEALGSGLPCVSFDCMWGPSEMIENGVNGLLVQSENVPALASALSRVMGDSALRVSLSHSALASAKRFSKSEILLRWDQVLQETVGVKFSPADVAVNR